MKPGQDYTSSAREKDEFERTSSDLEEGAPIPLQEAHGISLWWTPDERRKRARSDFVLRQGSYAIFGPSGRQATHDPDWAALNFLLHQTLSGSVSRQAARYNFEIERNMLIGALLGPREYYLPKQLFRKPVLPEPTIFHVDSVEKTSQKRISPHEEPSVRVSALLKKGSMFLVLISTLSLLSWIVSAVPIISPFVSLLILVSVPFIYLMGYKIEKSSKNL